MSANWDLKLQVILFFSNVFDAKKHFLHSEKGKIKEVS